MDSKTFLTNLKVGDQVIVGGGTSWNPDYITKVTKITRTQIVCDTLRFRRDNGRQIAATKWHTRYLHEPTLERVMDIRVANARAKLSRFNWSTVTNETLLKVWEMVRPL